MWCSLTQFVVGYVDSGSHFFILMAQNVMDLIGSDTFQSEDEMLRMWGESMKDVNCKTEMCHIEYDDFLLLMKGQKKVVQMRRSLEPLGALHEIPVEDDAYDHDVDEMPNYIPPEQYLADLPPNDIPKVFPPELSNSPTLRRQGSNSAPATPSHIGKRFDAIDQAADSPLLDENRVTFDEQVFAIPPLDLTPPQTPVRGPQDYATPTARRVLLNPQLLETLKSPELSLSPHIPGRNAIHSSFTTPLVKGRYVSLDEKDTFSAQMAAASRASTLFRRDSRRAMAIPEHTHNISELDKIIQDESKTALVVNRRLYRAHREFRHSVTAACKRFEDEKLRRAMETLKARENELQSKHTAGLVMRHGQALNDQSIKNFLKKTMEEQQAAVDQANRRGGRGSSSRKKTISDMSGMLQITPEPPRIKKVVTEPPSSHRAPGSMTKNTSRSNIGTTELSSVKENENLLRNPTKPGQFHKTNYDPFLQRKSSLFYGSNSPSSTAQQAPTRSMPPPLPL